MNTAKTLVIRTANACTGVWTQIVVFSVLAGLVAVVAVPIHVR